MNKNLANFPDKGDDKYWPMNSDDVAEFDYTTFNADLEEWKEGFEKELRERLTIPFKDCITVKEILGE